MQVETLKISSLVFDPSNARKHSKQNIESIKGSLRNFGQRKPIVVDRNGLIVAGNGTVEAARALGWKMVDVVRVPKEWTEEEIKAFALADNRTAELAEWNEDVLAKQLMDLTEVGFDVETIGFDGVEESPGVFEPVEDSPRLDEKAKTTCPECGHEF